MKEKLIEALQKLDVTNDNQWTTDGLPKLDALKFVVGGSVTREEVNEAAPGFTRANPVIGEPTNANDTPAKPEGEQSTSEPVIETKSDQQAEPNLEVAQATSGTETGSAGTSAQADADPDNVVTHSINVNVGVSIEDVIQRLFGDSELVAISGLSEDELRSLAEQHSAIVAEDERVLAIVSQRIRARAMYLNDVAEAVIALNPKETLAGNLQAFREAMTGSNSLPINQPRHIIRNGNRFSGR